jgi:hypothetical protein
MTNEEFWQTIDMQQQYDEELNAISEIILQNKDGSSIRALYLMCKMIDRDFQLPSKPNCEYAELVREAACSLIDALTLYAVKMDIDLKRDLEIIEHIESRSSK